MHLVPSGAPVNFTAIGTPTSIILRWDLPTKRHRNGDIILYEVIYYDQAKSDYSFVLNTTETIATVEDIKPATDYIFLIRAYNTRGPGPWSNRLPFRTFATRRKLFIVSLLFMKILGF